MSELDRMHEKQACGHTFIDHAVDNLLSGVCEGGDPLGAMAIVSMMQRENEGDRQAAEFLDAVGAGLRKKLEELDAPIIALIPTEPTVPPVALELAYSTLLHNADERARDRQAARERSLVLADMEMDVASDEGVREALEALRRGLGHD